MRIERFVDEFFYIFRRRFTETREKHLKLKSRMQTNDPHYICVHVLIYICLNIEIYIFTPASKRLSIGVASSGALKKVASVCNKSSIFLLTLLVFIDIWTLTCVLMKTRE